MALPAQNEFIKELASNLMQFLHPDATTLDTATWPQAIALVRAHDACLDQPLTIADGNRSHTGIGHGIDDTGNLLVKTAEGLTTCQAGSVYFEASLT